MYPETAFLLTALLLSTSSPLAQNGTAAQPYDDDQAYRVYSVLLPKQESAEFAKDTLVIREESVVSPEPPEACLTDAANKKFAEAIADYKRVNGKPWLLQRQFEVQRAYEIVNTYTIDILLRRGGWDAFYQRYPGSGGYAIFSAVGFNKDKTQAIVYAGSSCGNLCGRWGLHLLEKIGNQWKEVQGVTCVTVS